MTHPREPIIKPPQPTRKQCSKCLEEKNANEFYLRKNGQRRPDCKMCVKERRREYRAENLEKVKAQDRACRAKNPVCIKTYSVEYLEARRARRRVSHRAHPEKNRANSTRRRALKRGAAQSVPIRHIDIAERDNWICHICHKKVTRKNWSLDHLHELSKGGSHIPENVALAHVRCNSRRGARGKIPVQMRLLG